MKVYYEKSKPEKLINEAALMAEKYENATGVAPNRISVTREEYEIMRVYAETFKALDEGITRPFFQRNQLHGMEIVIEG